MKGLRAMTQTERLIERFDLSAAVEEFVRTRAREAAEKPQGFSFEGMCRRCGNSEPHVPHVTDSYSTVRYGRLSYYCAGVSGDGLEIVVEGRSAGSPESPSRLRGYWITGKLTTTPADAG